MLYTHPPPPMPYHTSHTEKHGHTEKTEKLKSHDLEGTALSKLCEKLNHITIQVDVCKRNPYNPLCDAMQLIKRQIEEHC